MMGYVLPLELMSTNYVSLQWNVQWLQPPPFRLARRLLIATRGDPFSQRFHDETGNRSLMNVSLVSAHYDSQCPVDF